MAMGIEENKRGPEHFNEHFMSMLREAPVLYLSALYILDLYVN